MEKESIFTPTFVINTLISFLFYIVFYVLTSSIGTYALQQLHQSTVVSLSLSSVFVIGALIGRVWTGINITRIGMKRLLYIGGIIFLVLTFGYYLTTNIPLLFLIRVIQGAGFGMGQRRQEQLLDTLCQLHVVVKGLVIMPYPLPLQLQLVQHYQS